MALKWDDLFYCIAYDYSCADWDSLCDHLRDVHGKISLNSELLLLVNSVSGFVLANTRSSLTHIHGFHLHGIVAKRLLRLPNLHMLIKQKSLSLPRNLALRTLGKLQIVFSTKVNLLYFLYSTVWRCCLLYLTKQNCLLETFLTTLILMTQVYLYLFSLLELI